MAFSTYALSVFLVLDLVLDPGHPEVSQDRADPGAALVYSG